MFLSLISLPYQGTFPIRLNFDIGCNLRRNDQWSLVIPFHAQFSGDDANMCLMSHITPYTDIFRINCLPSLNNNHYTYQCWITNKWLLWHSPVIPKELLMNLIENTLKWLPYLPVTSELMTWISVSHESIEIDNITTLNKAKQRGVMITSSNKNNFLVTGPLWEESTGHWSSHLTEGQ